MAVPQRSGLESCGHKVTAGKTILSIGKVSTTDFMGFSIQPASRNFILFCVFCFNVLSNGFAMFIYRSRALKSRSKLRAAIGLRASLQIFLLHQNSRLFTVTFGEKVLTLAKSRRS